jgi:hypothetical protein
MNGFGDRGLDEDAFGQKKGGLASFDAFRKFPCRCLRDGYP